MRFRGLPRVVVTAGLVAGLLSVPFSAQAAPPPVDAARLYSVTLVTGDRVTVASSGDTWEIRDIEPGRRIGGHGGFLHHAGPDGVTVIPRDAVPLVRAGRLDDAFFDVTGLIRQGYDDASTTDLPLLVTAADRTAVASLGAVTRELGGDDRLTAVATPKSAAAFETVAAAAGTKIWLNGKAFPSLDESVPQVGAPEAWAAGHTGAGATIAVLDTGYDPGHPDLAGVVTGERDFLGQPSGIRDEDGHGTHVASTAAGRGTASGGAYTGVAKGANLMVGKVCGADGCPYDAIIAGMRWAAESGARVVNMSFGGGPGAGTDPIETELNRLSAEYGTLFVVSAGNFGGAESVSTPASADAALAVASVNKQDVLSDFSSRGPRYSDAALKPDLAAPGESIVAARAAGTLDDYAVDEHHARLDGTSMAAPHVAGAAAILAARHPDWTGEQLKAALMSTAHPIDAGVYAQGTGRLDVARAVTQPVTANPASLSMGAVRWPHDGPAPEPRTVTYRNTGDADVTLRLALTAWDESGAPVPAGMFTADRSEVTVPAGGTAAVTVTFDPTAGPVGTYGGRLVATGGDTVVQTTVGGYEEPESYDLTLRMIDRDGRELPAGALEGVALVQSLDEHEGYYPVFANEPVRLPAGRYAVMGSVETAMVGHPMPSLTLVAEPELVVDDATTVTFDARRGTKVGVGVDRPGSAVAAGVSGMQATSGPVRAGYLAGTLEDLYAVPTTGDTDGFVYYNRAQVEQPLVRLTVDAPESFEVPVAWVPDSPEQHGTRVYQAVDVGHASPAELAAHDLTGKLAVFTLGASDKGEFDARLAGIAAAGASAALFWFSEPIGVGVGEVPIPVAYTQRPEGGRLAALGTASVTLTGIAASPYRYELLFPHPGGIPSTMDYRPRDRELATVRASYHRAGESIAYLDFGTYAHGSSFSGGLWSSTVPLPFRRTEYYTADPVSWDLTVRTSPGGGGDEHQFDGPEITYRAGEKRAVAWNKAVLGPALSVDRSAYTGQPYLVARDGDTVSATLPLLSDGARHSGYPRWQASGDTALYADGELVSRSGLPGEGTFEVPAEAVDFRLTSDVARDGPLWPLSTHVSAEWTFRSAHTGERTPLPLLAVGFAPDVNLDNNAPAGRRFTIPVTVHRQTGATGGRVALDRVEYSVDDGRTWQRARPRMTGAASWVISVPNPATGFVSLRAAASDRDGNTVTQTVLRAYQVG